MRVLFLDFGGVTHPSGADDDARQPTEGGHRQAALGLRLDVFCWFDILVGLLAGHDDVFVVVHSNWRYAYSSDEIGDMLGDLGSRYLGCTPLGGRYESIRQWLAKNRGVSSHRILDDSARAFPDPPPRELILCDPRTGLSEPLIQEQLKAWLRAE